VPEESVFASYLIRLSAHKGILPKFLYYFFQSGAYWEQIGIKKGGLQGNVNATTLSSLEFSICPFNEQVRIVAKIEELFSELDNGIESLKSVQTQLQVYRQALLKSAFEGELTVRWRAKNKNGLETGEQFIIRSETTGGNCTRPRSKQLETITDKELQDFPSLPAGWTYCRLGVFVEAIQAGKSFKCDEREPRDNEVGVAKVSAVTWGEYDDKESKTCVDLDKMNPNLYIREGDFLFSRANTIELVGACVIVRATSKNIMLSDKTLRILFHSGEKGYFLQYLRSHAGRNEIRKRST
jgi:type I restriction enzyme S subunit